MGENGFLWILHYRGKTCLVSAGRRIITNLKWFGDSDMTRTAFMQYKYLSQFKFVNAKRVNCRCAGVAVFMAALAVCVISSPSVMAETQFLGVRAAGFKFGESRSIFDGTNRLELALDLTNPTPLPFDQSAVKQGAEPARFGPDAKQPYFTVRFAMPVPPENDTNLTGALVGLDTNVLAHNHSPGFEILPNGDALAVYFTARDSRGPNESTSTTCFVQARLRYGSEQWDFPELFLDLENFNDQSALLWNDRGTLRFFGGGRGLTPWLPFRTATSSDNGATWTLSLPQLDKPAEDFTPQPINSAFRGADGALYFAMDAAKDESFLWRSADGIHWHDQGGRTGARHSTIVPLDDQGDLLSFGGKNCAVNGWSPENISTNYGRTWSESKASPFPPLGGNQRPSLIRLANGHLFYASDSYIKKSGKSPDGWKLGQGAFVAISTNNGASWHFKKLPVTLPHHEDRHFGTLGYVTARQAPNGVIHILTTMTQPCLHYELNEAWVFSKKGELKPETSGGELKDFTENFPNGKIRSQWTARICPNGRYLLDGKETDFYDTGVKQHEVTYASGRKTGEETFWSADGTKLWSWSHDLKRNRSVWTQFWPNGRKKVESTWNTKPEARDVKHSFFGLVADGPAKWWNEAGQLVHSYRFSNGKLAGEASAP